MASPESEKRIPAYIPWRTFLTFIDHLKANVVPARIDNSVMPNSWAGGVKGQIRSGIRFLGLITADDNVVEHLKKLVEARETDEWKPALITLLNSAYQPLLGDLKVASATPSLLREKFRAAGAEGQVLDKAIRFYLAGLREAGVTYSVLLDAHGNKSTSGTSSTRSATKRAPKAQKSPESNSRPAPDHSVTHTAHCIDVRYQELPIPIPGSDGPPFLIHVPPGLQKDDWAMILSILRSWADRQIAMAAGGERAP